MHGAPKVENGRVQVSCLQHERCRRLSSSNAKISQGYAFTPQQDSLHAHGTLALLCAIILVWHRCLPARALLHAMQVIEQSLAARRGQRSDAPRPPHTCQQTRQLELSPRVLQPSCPQPRCSLLAWWWWLESSPTNSVSCETLLKQKTGNGGRLGRCQLSFDALSACADSLPLCARRRPRAMPFRRRRRAAPAAAPPPPLIAQWRRRVTTKL
eukprot:5756938-Pleurochrysis_carterae.AAC.1